MCGIVGGRSIDIVERGVEMLNHRGPDAQGVVSVDGLGIKTSIAKTIANPKRFYNAEYKRLYST